MFRHQAWIILVAGVVFFAGLGRPRLWDDDETKNARCAQEMLVRGDWVVPTFNFRLRPDKPALFYWLAMISYHLLGTSELAARFPSALLAVGTSLATYHLGRRLFRPEVGLWAGLAMASNVMFATIGRAATPDSTLIFCTTIALLAYVVGVGRHGFEALVPRSWWGFVIVYAAMGLAVLAKGPVGVVLPAAAIGAFVLFEGSRFHVPPARPEFGTLGSQLRYSLQWVVWRLRSAAREFPTSLVAMRPLTLILTVLAVALPWYACVAIRTHGVWWHDFFWDHNVQRFMASREGHHGWFLFPPLTLMAFFFPWSLILPFALATVFRRLRATGSASAFILASAAGSGQGENDAAACRLLLWWSAAWIVFFSFCGTKQPNYIVPAYPALAVLVGLWIADWVAAPQRLLGRRFLPAFWSAIGLNGVGLAAALLIIARWFPETARFSWIGLIPIVGAGCAWFFARRHLPRLAMASVVASTALLLATVLGGVAVPLSKEQNGVRLGEFVAHLPEPPSKIGQFRLSFVGLVYYADRKIEELATPDDAAALFAGAEHPLVVTDQVGFEQMEARLPGYITIIGQEPRFCRPGSMVLVAPAPLDIADRKGSSTTR